MTTTYLKLPYVDSVLRERSLRALELGRGPVGFSLDVGLNYYRGLPLSTIETFELSVDGERIADNLLLFEYDRKLYPLGALAGGFSDFWSVKKPLRVRVYQGGLAPGEHEVELKLVLRSPYMHLGPGLWGMIDGSASRTLMLQEA
ncbi:C-glycoside deglycosidase beta subunit domain-containing protein [Humibacter sp.]|uniref:C-glycoside deglycosidase beta subunit domain-containing protein n=1 Tax=Humibacter sp. TaxID=1940291 RepID=UPI003F7D8766